MLEDRITPTGASFYWTGATANGYGDVANWYAPGYHDHDIPVSGDYIFLANGWVTSDVTIPNACAFAGISSSQDYSGTITLQDETSTQTLYFQGGSIGMAGSSSSGNDFYVTGSFLFTGDTLNTSANTGTVHIRSGLSAFIGSNTEP